MPCCGTASTGRDMTPRDHAIHWHQASIICTVPLCDGRRSFSTKPNQSIDDSDRPQNCRDRERTVVTKKKNCTRPRLLSPPGRVVRQAALRHQKDLERFTTVKQDSIIYRASFHVAIFLYRFSGQFLRPLLFEAGNFRLSKFEERFADHKFLLLLHRFLDVLFFASASVFFFPPGCHRLEFIKN